MNVFSAIQHLDRRVWIAFGIGVATGIAIDRLVSYISNAQKEEEPKRELSFVPETVEEKESESDSDISSTSDEEDNVFLRNADALFSSEELPSAMHQEILDEEPEDLDAYAEKVMEKLAARDRPAETEAEAEHNAFLEIMNQIDEGAFIDNDQFPDVKHITSADLFDYFKVIKAAQVADMGIDDEETRRTLNNEFHMEHEDQSWWCSYEDMRSRDDDENSIRVNAIYLVDDDDWVFENGYEFSNFSDELPKPLKVSKLIVRHNLSYDEAHQVEDLPDGTQRWKPELYMHSCSLGGDFIIETYDGSYFDWAQDHEE